MLTLFYYFVNLANHHHNEWMTLSSWHFCLSHSGVQGWAGWGGRSQVFDMKMEIVAGAQAVR